MPVLVVRLVGALVLCSVVLLLLWLSLAVPPMPVALLGALDIVVLRPPVVPVPVLCVLPALLRAPRRSLRMLVGIVFALPVLLVSAQELCLRVGPEEIGRQCLLQ